MKPVGSVGWNSEQCDRIYAISKPTSQRSEQRNIDGPTDEIARARHLLGLWLDIQCVLEYSWLDSHTLGRFRAPKASLGAKMGKNSVFLHDQGTRMARSDHKVVQVRRSYAGK
jgi:hypothetical protein